MRFHSLKGIAFAISFFLGISVANSAIAVETWTATGTKNGLYQVQIRLPNLSDIIRKKVANRIKASKQNPQKTIASLSESTDIQLVKLSQYKRAMSGTFGEEMMIFLNMPKTEKGVLSLAENMSNIILEYKKNHVKPVFLFEPYDENHKEIIFSELKNGSYDVAMYSLFSRLKNYYGIRGEDIGVLVPYPELNTPAYKRVNFEVSDFPLLVNLFFDTVRKVYPTVEGGILLDSKSYAIGKKWGEGSFSSFLPYIKGIKPGAIQYFGIQGFPWVSNDGKIEAYDPKYYLPLDITHEAAKYLGVKSIWFNTGVMKKKYRENTIVLSSEEYGNILNNILNQGNILKEKGFQVSIHIFAQNKFSLPEATDWSFLGDKYYERVFENFLSQAEKSKVSISIFDKLSSIEK